MLESEEIKRQAQELLKQCVIKPSVLPCVSSPIVLVPNKDASLHGYMNWYKLFLYGNYEDIKI